jgi:hypothetical protein
MKAVGRHYWTIRKWKLSVNLPRLGRIMYYKRFHAFPFCFTTTKDTCLRSARHIQRARQHCSTHRSRHSSWPIGQNLDDRFGRTDSAKQELTPSNLAISDQRFVRWFVKRCTPIVVNNGSADIELCRKSKHVDDGGTSMAEGTAKRIKRRLCFNKSFAYPLDLLIVEQACL